MPLRFEVDGWTAWAPGLTTHSAWQSWFRQPLPVAGTDVPGVHELSALLRRRLEPLGRIALQCAYCATNPTSPDPDGAELPIIFASRYGEMTRTLAMLSELGQGNALSPTAFSMSVHNAVGAVFSCARNAQAPYTAIAAGAETAEAGIFEALALLAEGHPSVLLVYYDAPLPPLYASFAGDQNFAHAWACWLSKSHEGGIDYAPTEARVARTAELPPDLALLRFLVSSCPEHRRTLRQCRWHWNRRV